MIGKTITNNNNNNKKHQQSMHEILTISEIVKSFNLTT